MTISTNYNFRIMDNNLIVGSDTTAVVSSELTNYPFTNALNYHRSKQWKGTGHFEVTASNSAIYINDGALKTISLIAGDYTTGALLATHMQSRMTAASSGWAVTYTPEYKFQITNSIIANTTLVLSDQTNAIWDDIGFTGTVDSAGTIFLANEQRNHTDESIIFDLGYSATITSFAAIGEIDQEFSLSSNATITIQADNVNDFTSPALSTTATRTDSGAFLFLDYQIADTAYRYWKIKFEDKLNPLGPEDTVAISYLYLGDHTSLVTRNISNGFTKTVIDPSIISTSETGSLYFDNRPKYCRFESVGIGLIDKTDRQTLEQLYARKGATAPFFISLDPNEVISYGIDDLTKFVVFEDKPDFKHVIRDLTNFTISFREMV